MKIINIYNGFLTNDLQGGGVRYLKNLIIEQKNLGYEVEVICCGPKKCKSKKIDGVKFNYICSTLEWPKFLISLVLYFIKNSKNYSNEAFHIHRSYFALALFFIRDRKIILTTHTKTFHVLLNRFKFIYVLLPFLIFIENFIINNFINKLSVAGYEAKKNYINRKILDKKIYYLPPQINLPQFKTYKNKKLILIVGRLSTVKRPLSVIKLINNAYQFDKNLISTYKFIFIGDGELKYEIIKLINSYQLNRIIKLRGNLPYIEVMKYFSQCDKSILLSESEINPYVVKESLSYGKPVFVCDVGDVKRYFTQECGYLISKNNPETYFKEFIAFLKTDYSSNSIKSIITNQLSIDKKYFTNNLNKLYE